MNALNLSSLTITGYGHDSSSLGTERAVGSLSAGYPVVGGGYCTRYSLLVIFGNTMVHLEEEKLKAES